MDSTTRIVVCIHNPTLRVSTNSLKDLLLVKHIRDVQWNKNAFDRQLVLDGETKELIQITGQRSYRKEPICQTRFHGRQG
jgi:hypothetical protein